MSKLSKVFKQSLNPFKADQIGPLAKYSVTKNWTKIRPYAGAIAGAVLGFVTGGAGWAAAAGALKGAAIGSTIDAKGEQIRQMDQAHREEQQQQMVAAYEEQKASQEALEERRDSLEKLRRQTQVGGGRNLSQTASAGSSPVKGNTASIILG